MSFTKHTEIYISSVISKPINETWEKIKGFNDMDWAQVPSVPVDSAQPREANIIGKDRQLTVGGKHIVERLTAYDNVNHSYTYAIITAEDGIFPGKFQHYTATLTLKAVTDGDHTFAQWTASFNGEADTADAVAQFIGSNVFLPSLTKLN
eukprot:TRINITY_DN2954_c0_g2_i1.p2 TRINITY_DN2954_c0_g2~~TRINITY_DN2954_c0_g2_i1.p2  ORF type:complete len:150 (+),score=34.11 TRINITY_DN2954_c0_g2_i1:120-569(+)